MILDNFTIPKDNLLGKFGDIDNEGNYKSQIKSSNQRFGLFMSALSGGRGAVALGTCAPALNALTIALRYSCSRKQFDNPKKTD
jgi:acyl-CoA oxidase